MWKCEIKIQNIHLINLLVSLARTVPIVLSGFHYFLIFSLYCDVFHDFSFLSRCCYCVYLSAAKNCCYAFTLCIPLEIWNTEWIVETRIGLIWLECGVCSVCVFILVALPILEYMDTMKVVNLSNKPETENNIKNHRKNLWLYSYIFCVRTQYIVRGKLRANVQHSSQRITNILRINGEKYGSVCVWKGANEKPSKMLFSPSTFLFFFFQTHKLR